MNYFSHFFLDKDSADSLFFVGIATPDLISTFDRSKRLKASQLHRLQASSIPPGKLSFHRGVMRHFEVDRVFHSSDFFKRETVLLTRKLQKTFGKERVPRAFFVSHILLELILDRILINQHSALLYSFYRHFEHREVKDLVALTEWIMQQPLPGYDAFLKRFSEKQFLYHYAHWDFLINVTRSILTKVGVQECSYLDSDKFLVLMHTYEAGLTRRAPRALRELEAMLSPKVTYSTE